MHVRLLSATVVLALTATACQFVGNYEPFEDPPCDPPERRELPGPELRRVNLPGRCVWMDETEVTVAQYDEYLRSGAAENPARPRSGECDQQPEDSFLCANDAGSRDCQKPEHPITQVSWCDAFAFCAWAQKSLCGDDYDEPTNRLLSDWFATCSNDGTSAFPYGNRYRSEACNGARDRQACALAGDCLDSVAQRSDCQTDSEIFDMSGNVAEWTQACWSSSRKTGDSPSLCTVRGGHFASLPLDAPQHEDEARLGCASVGTFDRLARRNDVGFRCCWYPKAQ